MGRGQANGTLTTDGWIEFLSSEVQSWVIATWETQKLVQNDKMGYG